MFPFALQRFGALGLPRWSSRVGGRPGPIWIRFGRKSIRSKVEFIQFNRINRMSLLNRGKGCWKRKPVEFLPGGNMATCEEWAATIATLQAALIVDDATIQAANNVKTAHQMELWYAEYNFFLQGCGGTDGGSGSGSGSGSGYGAAVIQGKDVPVFPVRTPSELVLIMSNRGLFALHKRAEDRARLIGLVG